MKIVQAPEPVLSQKAAPIEKIDKSIKNLLKDMDKTLKSASDPEGVGLAAPQVGKSLQIFIIREEPEAPLQVFINPVIERYFDAPPPKTGQTTKKKEKNVQLEGCLSLKDIWGVVKRHYGVNVSYMDAEGKTHKKEFRGFLATIIQHEVDHLQGNLFTKRVLEQKNKLYHSVKNKKGETEFDEIEV
jgi:peptide deformylase